MYIWQQPRWPEFSWDARTLAGYLADPHKEQDRLLGRMETLELESRSDALDLLERGVLVKNPEGGRSTGYSLAVA